MREIIYVIRNKFKNSNGKDELEKRQYLSMLTGRTPDSFKTVAKTIHQNAWKYDVNVKEILDHWNRPSVGANGT